MFGREELIKPSICNPSEVIDYVNQSNQVMDKMEAHIKELEEDVTVWRMRYIGMKYHSEEKEEHNA